mgnify:CR=1 FL=1
MSNHIDFYFDIISPYSYIAHKKIQKIKENQKIIFNYKPILLGGLHNLAEITAPAFNKYKMKNIIITLHYQQVTTKLKKPTIQ